MSKEKPILFSGEMVRAILSGTKTQTRRVMKPQPVHDGQLLQFKDCQWIEGGIGFPESGIVDHAPYKPGDRLWVRETWARCSHDGWYEKNGSHISYRADKGIEDGWKWKPSVHMPYWASRISLEVTGMRVERLNDISEDDARAEGITDAGCLNCGEHEPCGCPNPEPDAVDAFAHIWRSTYGDYFEAGEKSWIANPWVWVISFRVLSMKNE